MPISDNIIPPDPQEHESVARCKLVTRRCNQIIKMTFELGVADEAERQRLSEAIEKIWQEIEKEG